MVVPFTIGRPFPRPANRKIPSWHGPAAQGCQRREPHFSPRLCDGNDRRGGKTESYSAAFYGGMFYGGILKRARPLDYLLAEFDLIALQVTSSCAGHR